jgi:hypothetical protein
VKAFQGALNLNARFADARYNLVYAYLGLRDKDSAQREFRVLQVIDPSLAAKLEREMKNLK